MATQNSTQILRQQLLTRLEDSTREAGLTAIREILTEENTDALIEILLDRISLPFWLSWLPIGKVLDKMLPETLLNLFEDLLA